jgi:trehalose 6-phosphate synthase/phosphatase
MDAGSGDWKESVQLVFEYFCERTPRSFVEQRGTSLVWNYKYADVEFGRIQARDLLQHLLTGPISNAPVDIVRGSKSVEVRPVGVSKGASMERILQYMAGQPLLPSFWLLNSVLVASPASMGRILQYMAGGCC